MRSHFPFGHPLDRATPAAHGFSVRNLGILLVALLASVVAGYTGYQRYAAATEPVVTYQTAQARIGSLVSTVTATGNVVSTKQSKLGFSASSTASGKITEIDVKVGDSVKTGQHLAKLDTSALQAQLDQAQSNLKTAQIKLQQTQAGATPEDRAAAQAAYDSAVANYQQVAAGATAATLQADQSAVDEARANLASAQAKLQAAQTPYTDADIAAAKTALEQAQAGVVSAQAKLDATKNPYTQADLAAAQAAVESTSASLKTAQANLTQLKTPTQADIASAQAAVDQAKSSLMSAEDRYQMVQNGNLQEAGGTSNSAVEQDYNTARANYDAAVQKLNQLMAGPLPGDLQSAESAVTTAQANYDSAAAKLNLIKQGPLATDVTQAQSALDQAKANLAAAQAKYDLVMAGPVATDITQAQNAVDSGNAALSSALAKLNQDKQGPTAADLAAAKNAVAQAAATLASKTPQDSDIALAQEAVNQAQAAYDQAKVNLANAVLTAPFDGMIAAVDANVGEQVGSSSIFTLVDTSQVRIDGTVGETDVVNVQVGQPATIIFDALPGSSFTGKVIAVSPSGTSTQGVVSYPVSVSIDNPNRTLPAGLSATVNIVTQQKDNVLLIPLRALHTQGQNHTVEVLPAAQNAKPETRQVQIGAQNDQQAEIVSGLSAGDRVVIPSTSTTQPRVNLGAGGLGGGFRGPVGR